LDRLTWPSVVTSARSSFPLRDGVAVISEDVIMSKVILDIRMSLDTLIAQPDDNPGPLREFSFSAETEHDAIFRTSGAPRPRSTT
jgi:hypothetical protein